MKKVTTIISITLFLIWGCVENQDIDCVGEPTQIPFETLLPDSISQTCRLQNIDENKQIVNLIIQTQVDYEKYVICTASLPSIDFSNKTLLAGRMKTPNMDKIIRQSVTMDCNNAYLYAVDIGYGIATSPSDVYYYVIITKISANTKIEFDINYIN